MQKLEEMIVALAKEHKKTIATAESVTGGRIASGITSISGASEIFVGGVVAYSSHAKIHSAGVNVTEIEKNEGYSKNTALMMAESIRKRNVADFAISTTGCAGPTDNEWMKTGQIFFGVSRKNHLPEVFEMQFEGTREEILHAATEYAFKKILHFLSFA